MQQAALDGSVAIDPEQALMRANNFIVDQQEDTMQLRARRCLMGPEARGAVF